MHTEGYSCHVSVCLLPDVSLHVNEPICVFTQAKILQRTFTKLIIELITWQMQAKDVPHLVVCLPRLQPLTEGGVPQLCLHRTLL